MWRLNGEGVCSTQFRAWHAEGTRKMLVCITCALCRYAEPASQIVQTDNAPRWMNALLSPNDPLQVYCQLIHLILVCHLFVMSQLPGVQHKQSLGQWAARGTKFTEIKEEVSREGRWLVSVPIAVYVSVREITCTLKKYSFPYLYPFIITLFTKSYTQISTIFHTMYQAWKLKCVNFHGSISLILVSRMWWISNKQLKYMIVHDDIC